MMDNILGVVIAATIAAVVINITEKKPTVGLALRLFIIQVVLLSISFGIMTLLGGSSGS